MKVALTCSAGGHLSEMLQLEAFYRKHTYFFITFDRADSRSVKEKEKVYFITRPGRNIFRALQNCWQSLQVLLKEQPDLVIATGADVSVMSCWWAKLLGKKVVYIESFCRPVNPSLSGRLVYPIADLFVVQWKAVWKHYPKAKFGGSIF